VQHFHYHLAPYGIAGFVLANGSLSSQQSGEGEIRQKLIEADQIDCIVALPGQLFATTQIPVCLWFVARDKSNGLLKERKLRDRRGEVLFIDARRLGRMATRTVKVLDDVDVARVADTYHAWRERGGSYADTPGFARAASLAEIAAQGHVLTPGRYVGATEAEDNDEPFDSRVRRLTEELAAQMTEGADLDARIRQHLMGVGYGW
jgi:type I restriction enzyme M protein